MRHAQTPVLQRYPPVVMSRQSQTLPFTVDPSTTSILPCACACPVALHAQVLVLLGCPPTVISRQSESLPLTVVSCTTQNRFLYTSLCNVMLHAQVLVLLGCPPTVISHQSWAGPFTFVSTPHEPMLLCHSSPCAGAGPARLPAHCHQPAVRGAVWHVRGRRAHVQHHHRDRASAGVGRGVNNVGQRRWSVGVAVIVLMCSSGALTREFPPSSHCMAALQVALIEEQWTWLHHLSIWGSPRKWST